MIIRGKCSGTNKLLDVEVVDELSNKFIGQYVQEYDVFDMVITEDRKKAIAIFRGKDKGKTKVFSLNFPIEYIVAIHNAAS